MMGPARTAELTLRVVVLGLVLSVVMAAANVYLGLYAGMTVSASIPAAVVAMLILRGLFKNGTILEANLVQTAASAGESLSAGIIFTMPALLLIGAWQRFDFWMTTAIAFTGGLLGILFMIPMRRVFVTDNKELPYPEGVACAAVLRTGSEADEGSGARGGALGVVLGAAIGAIWKFLASYLSVLLGALEGAVSLGASRVLFFGSEMSPALVGVGYIVRLNVAVLLFIGGAIGWFLCIPLMPELSGVLNAIHPGLSTLPAAEGSSEEIAWTLWSTQVRYIGVGAMVVGGFASILKVRHGLVRAVVELRDRFRQGPGERVADTDRDLGSGVVLALLAVTIVLIGLVYYRFTHGIVITAVTTITMAVLAFFFVAVASYIVGLVGNSNSPVSGMTITAVLITGGLLYVCGFAGQSGMVATLGVAAIVCCAACTSGDVCNDLKTGSLVGASPRRQQIVQIAGVAVASLVMAPVLQILDDVYGIGSRELSAPQASLFASLVRGFFGDGKLPWGMVGVGVALGLVVLVIDRVLEGRGSAFRAHLMPVAVGMYLPLGLSIPILAGGVLSHFRARGAQDGDDVDARMHSGILFSSGVIAGESLVGVLIALLVSMGVAGQTAAFPGKGLVTFVLAAFVLWVFWRRSGQTQSR
ncbi:MAG: oligopeptide transporter, OPT family [Myxococcales bacterium]|nr:oligopeptide transporter, OPT family [Myxococcales bacterium]